MKSSGYTTYCKCKILELFCQNADRTFPAADVFSALKADGGMLNLTTVYRNLEKLEQEKQIKKYVAEKGKKAIYQYADPHRQCDQHLHLKCTNCGAVMHLECSFMNEIEQHILKHHRFELNCRSSILYGLCQECLQNKNI